MKVSAWIVAAGLVVGAVFLVSRSGAFSPATTLDGAEAKPAVISVAEVAGLIERKAAAFVFDANPREIYAAGHVPGAKWVPFNEVKAEHLPADRKAMLIFYCYNEKCGASHRAARTAVELGFSNVRVMAAGIQGWKKANLATERE